MFTRRLCAALRALGEPCDPDDHWDAYLAGLYGACLREVTPETIALKAHFVARLDAALGDPHPDDPLWRTAA